MKDKINFNPPLTVSRPARYGGGDYGAFNYSNRQPIAVAVCYPDLYEIGMGNQALRIIYHQLNALEQVQCERVFAPALDFEEYLRHNGRILSTLESALPLRQLDLLLFTIGYELTLTNIFTILERGGITIRSGERKDGEPIVLGGGPAVVNPAPYSPFFDGIGIGECEAFLPQLITSMLPMKRPERLALLKQHPHIWHQDKREKTRRAIWNGFSQSESNYALPYPTTTPVQDHGFVEIMRGCPNGCRFCVAGTIYRPWRLKPPAAVVRETDRLVAAGYSSVTLSSLSSADYPHIADLISFLNNRYRERRVAISLPSLRVNSVTLGLIDQLSCGKKSGLTFALEMADETNRLRLNKEVDEERVARLLQTAYDDGWRNAKFYFMIGLPPSGRNDDDGIEADDDPKGSLDEVEAIAALINRLRVQCKIAFNINVGVFIPKPHTPYQRARQLTDEAAMQLINRLRRRLSGRRLRVKLNFHRPFVSFIEGVISRGDQRAGELALAAWQRGARLDGWDEHLRRDIWRQVINEADWPVEAESCRPRGEDEALPWSSVDSLVYDSWFDHEWRRSQQSEMNKENLLTRPCHSGCRRCGVCVDEEGSCVDDINSGWLASLMNLPPFKPLLATGSQRCQLIIHFSKSNIVLGHQDVMRMFEAALRRADWPIIFSQGYRPRARLEFARPLPLGVAGQDELLAVQAMIDTVALPEWQSRLDAALPPGFTVHRVEARPLPPQLKAPSLMAAYRGSRYRIEADDRCVLKLGEYAAAKRTIGVTHTTINERLSELYLPSVQNKAGENNIVRLLTELFGESLFQQDVTITRSQITLGAPFGANS